MAEQPILNWPTVGSIPTPSASTVNRGEQPSRSHVDADRSNSLVGSPSITLWPGDVFRPLTGQGIDLPRTIACTHLGRRRVRLPPYGFLR